MSNIRANSFNFFLWYTYLGLENNRCAAGDFLFVSNFESFSSIGLYWIIFSQWSNDIFRYFFQLEKFSVTLEVDFRIPWLIQVSMTAYTACNKNNGEGRRVLTAAIVRKSNTLQQYFQAFEFPYFVWHSSETKKIKNSSYNK